jgi:hypothetical protein
VHESDSKDSESETEIIKELEKYSCVEYTLECAYGCKQSDMTSLSFLSTYAGDTYMYRLVRPTRAIDFYENGL